MGVPWPYPDDGAETFIRDKILPKTENGEMLAWGITINEAGDDKVIGFISYHFEPDELGDNRGFWMAQHCWGKGYMTEAVTAMQDYIFFDLDIDFFIVGSLRSNIASRRIKEKLGGEFLKLDQIEHRNGETDSEKWIIKKENWKKIRSKSA